MPELQDAVSDGVIQRNMVNKNKKQDFTQTVLDLKKMSMEASNFLMNLTAYAIEIQQSINNYVARHEDFITKVAESIANLSTLPIRTSILQNSLQKRGWFMLQETPLSYFYGMEKDFAKGNLDIVDEKMSKIVFTFLDETEKQLLKKFPDRSSILKEGFENHRQGRFASSITLLLTQVDGICFDLFNHLYFSLDRNTRLPRTRKPIEDLGLDLLEQISLEPLMERIGINANDNEFKLYPDTLHRHEVLHGKDINYANEINSLKIISLIGYLGGVVYEIVSEIKKKSATT